MILHYISYNSIAVKISENKNKTSDHCLRKNSNVILNTCFILQSMELTPLVLLYQNLQKISVAHCGCSSATTEAQKQGLQTEALRDSLQAPCPSNDQS